MKALVLTSMVHPLGHFVEADMQGVENRLKGFREVMPGDTPLGKQKKIAGAGFKMQEMFSHEPEQKTANAIYKMVNLLLSQKKDMPNDLNMIKKVDVGAGQSASIGLLASTLSDLFLEGKKNSPRSADFWQDARTGTPGVKVHYRF